MQKEFNSVKNLYKDHDIDEGFESYEEEEE